MHKLRSIFNPLEKQTTKMLSVESVVSSYIIVLQSWQIKFFYLKYRETH